MVVWFPEAEIFQKRAMKMKKITMTSVEAQLVFPMI